MIDAMHGESHEIALNKVRRSELSTTFRRASSLMWFFHNRILNFLCDASRMFLSKTQAAKQVIAEFIIMDQRPHFHYDLIDLDITVQRKNLTASPTSLHLNDESTDGTDFFTDPCITKETSLH